MVVCDYIYKMVLLGAMNGQVLSAYIPTQGRPDNANYLYTGSRVEYFIGGKDAASKGIIQAVDARPITINNYAGHTAIDYEKGAPASAQGKGQVVINHAEKGSSVTMHSYAEALKGYANINILEVHCTNQQIS